MELAELWSLAVILAAAFVIGWAAETAQTFIPQALALSILAWLQTLPEFAVEANIAWHGQRELMIANLTGSLRLLVGLGWPMIFFTHFFFQGVRKKKVINHIQLEDQDFLSVLFLFISVLYFIVILFKHSLSVIDSAVLFAIYIAYLRYVLKFPPGGEESIEDLPWIGRQILRFRPGFRVAAVILLFAVGGWGLWVSVDPFVHTLQRWALKWGISSFVFIQWVAPFLSEFPEKLTAFDWARQPRKASMAVMNMVNSNINQWTMLAAMIPIVFSLSTGHWEIVTFTPLAWHELALTIAQSFLGVLLLLALQFSIWDAALLFVLWLTQFVWASVREEILGVYLIWSAWELLIIARVLLSERRPPRALALSVRFLKGENVLGNGPKGLK
ncbi:MAG: hypothetical protein HYR96_07035 [Deltaproteobacteria bacterium]|nr:hypothetical protein [Deltaproteobacteria bacterium]